MVSIDQFSRNRNIERLQAISEVQKNENKRPEF